MDARQLRTKYIQFFESKGHLRHDSSPLIPIDVTGKLDETLLFTGAGMVQFKPYFRGSADPPHTRLVTSQKCVRAVDIEEVGNPSHLTFFEMLGNFSFGDYFKEGAIQYAWEFLTSAEWLRLDPKKICVTVFHEDDDAYGIWEKFWVGAGFDASKKIHRLGEERNYWPAGAFSSGPPGPCGPCSEIFFQVADDHEMVGEYLADEAAGRWLEIWNLVFMQFEWQGELSDPLRPQLGYKKGGMERLPRSGVDTGMGLERTASVLGGFTQCYDTDVFSPIVHQIVNRVRGGAAPLQAYSFGSSESLDRSVRIIADHIRTASFCIADGIRPENSGRGYVLRRLIRRAMLKGSRNLQIKGSFLPDIFEGVVTALADPYIELSEHAEQIKTVLAAEERLFDETMSDGFARLNSTLVARSDHIVGSTLSGDYAFHLYDTYGFPLEVTQEIAAESGLRVDMDEYERAMKEAQARSRSARGSGGVFGGDDEPIVLVTSRRATTQTQFVGYDKTRAVSHIVQISPRFGSDGLSTNHLQVCLDTTPFYPESGGQVGDTGVIKCASFVLTVENTWKELGLIWHDCTLVESSPQIPLEGLSPGDARSLLESGVLFAEVEALVNEDLRRDITRNHTATHLLHAALRNALGKHVTQAGSLVAPDRLRFDFTHGEPLTQEQIARVEREVNAQIATAKLVSIADGVPIQSARDRGAMMLFGEKYGERVRVVEIPDFSVELCGGCHVAAVSEIGLFKIISEASSASGIRRIEAVTGRGAYDFVQDRDSTLKLTASKLKSSVGEIPNAIERLQEQLKEIRRERDNLRSNAAQSFAVEPIAVNGFNLYIQTVTTGGIETGKLTADRLIEKDPTGVAVVAVSDDESLVFFCKAGPSAVKGGVHAGNLARGVAEVTGGGGGGSPTFAQAGGKDRTKLEEALESAKDLLLSQLSRP